MPKLQRKNKQAKGAQGVFTELDTFLKMYQEIMGNSGSASTNSVSSLSSALLNLQIEIAKLKDNLCQDIYKQVIE